MDKVLDPWKVNKILFKISNMYGACGKPVTFSNDNIVDCQKLEHERGV